MDRVLLSLFIAFAFFGCSCDSEGLITNSNGEITYMPYIWKYPLFEKGNTDLSKPQLFGNWRFDKQALIITAKEGERPITLTAIDINSGEVNWQWDDWFNPKSELTNGRFVHLRNGVLHWKTGTRKYWVNLNDGTTVKSHNGSQNFRFQLGLLGDKQYVLGSRYDLYPGLKVQCLFEGDFYSEELEMILVPPVDLDMTLTNRASDITSVIPYVENNDTFLVMSSQQVFPNWDFQSYLSLYNLSKEEWVYDSIVLCDINRKGILYQPLKLYEDMVIMNVGKSLLCYEYRTGKKIWENEYDHDFFFSGFEVSEGVLVGSCENTTVYGLDVYTGRRLWSIYGGGGNSSLINRIMDGVVYWGGGSSGYFHAVDIHSGKSLWKLNPERYEDNGEWDWSITVMPNPEGGKGRVVIQNKKNAYCLEAAK